MLLLGCEHEQGRSGLQVCIPRCMDIDIIKEKGESDLGKKIGCGHEGQLPTFRHIDLSKSHCVGEVLCREQYGNQVGSRTNHSPGSPSPRLPLSPSGIFNLIFEKLSTVSPTFSIPCLMSYSFIASGRTMPCCEDRHTLFKQPLLLEWG